MPKPTTPVDPLELARPRAIEHLAPGCWWEVDYEEDGQLKQIWARVHAKLDLVSRVTGERLVQVIGLCTDGSRSDLTQLRGYGVPRTLRTAEGRRCGLTVPEV